MVHNIIVRTCTGKVADITFDLANLPAAKLPLFLAKIMVLIKECLDANFSISCSLLSLDPSSTAINLVEVSYYHRVKKSYLIYFNTMIVIINLTSKFIFHNTVTSSFSHCVNLLSFRQLEMSS